MGTVERGKADPEQLKEGIITQTTRSVSVQSKHKKTPKERKCKSQVDLTSGSNGLYIINHL